MQSIRNLPTYPAPTQQIFLTPPTPPPEVYSVASKDPLPLLRLVCRPAASSRASCSFIACRRGLNVRLPSGVVGAVEMSKRQSSESTVDAGCGNMIATRLVGSRRSGSVLSLNI